MKINQNSTRTCPVTCPGTPRGEVGMGGVGRSWGGMRPRRGDCDIIVLRPARGDACIVYRVSAAQPAFSGVTK